MADSYRAIMVAHQLPEFKVTLPDQEDGLDHRPICLGEGLNTTKNAGLSICEGYFYIIISDGYFIDKPAGE